MSGNSRARFVLYKPRKILNKSKRADHWFWSRYSAYPYLGCQHGCKFCYCREEKYSPYEDIDDFASLIKVKENAGELLRRELSRVPVNVIFTGDYQPLERKYQISRKMLEVCADLGFPVMILERSPLVLRDLDVIQTIQENTQAVVAFSVIYTESSPRAAILKQMEGLAPPPAKRLAAMEKIAASGVTTGVSMMPLLPGLCDDHTNLEEIIRATADHGGKFVLASTLTLGDQQRTYFMKALAERFPQALPFYEKNYPLGRYVPAGLGWNKTAVTIAELCEKYKISDRMPRPVIPGDKNEFNKRLVEVLANRAYELDIKNYPQNRVWVFRKAAWAVEDLEQDVRLIHRTMGRKGLAAIPDLEGEGLDLVEESIRKALDPHADGK
ncbi:MAG: radical SAM protein [Anaerolineaceae bacterium]